VLVKKGDKVRIDYEGFLDDGRIFDETKKQGFPMKLVVGDGLFLEEFEDNIIGMKVGEVKTIRIPPSKAYGIYNSDLIDIIPLTDLEIQNPLEIGNLLVLSESDGSKTPAKIIDFSETDVTLDFNHPLAGITLNYKLTLVEILPQ
jgi:peptidylprolyl isomerase